MVDAQETLAPFPLKSGTYTIILRGSVLKVMLHYFPQTNGSITRSVKIKRDQKR